MKKIGITGGVGFIGSYVIDELLSRGYEPVVFDHHQHPLHRQVEVFLGDVRDEVAMTEFAAHVDGIIHLAAVLGTQETIKNPRPAAQSNLMGGLNFLEACAQYDLPGVYIAVGNYWMNNPYSITKNMIERFTHMFNKDRGTRINIVRAVNAYGPRQLAATPFAHGKVRKITPAFVCRALSGMPIEVYGDGEQVSDMVYVGDVAKALVTALEKANQHIIFEKAVEVGPEDNRTVNEIASLVAKICAEFTGLEAPVIHLPMRPGEIAGSDVTANTSTLRLVEMPVGKLVRIDEGMRRTVEYFVENQGKTWQIPPLQS